MPFINLFYELLFYCVAKQITPSKCICTVQLKGNLTPACGLPVEQMQATTQNSQLTGMGACKGNLKHLLGHCNQESVLIQ